MARSELIRFKAEIASNPELKIKLKAVRKDATRLAVANFARELGFMVDVQDFGKDSDFTD